MDKKRILIWDDNASQAARITGSVETAKAVHNWPLYSEVHSDSFQRFLEFLKENHKDYDLLIIDCLEGGEEVITQALDTLTALSSDILVLAITIDSLRMGNHFTGLSSRFSRCRSVYKQLFYDPKHSEGCENLLSEMLGLKKTREGVTGNISMSIEPDLYLEYVIQSIGGAQILKQLILKLKEELMLDLGGNSFGIELLSQGLSGAIALKLNIKGEFHGNSDWFLKIATDPATLGRELHNVMYGFDKIPSKYRLKYMVNTPVSIDGKLYALIAELATDSSPIRKAILEDTTGETSLRMIEELMNQCMKEFYKRSTTVPASTAIVHDIMKVFDIKRLSFLQKSIQELEMLTNGSDITKDIERYKGSSKPGETFYSKDNLKRRLVHGDFHANNILVTKSEDIVVIDPANIDTDHWSRDVCLLAVDLFAYGIDAQSKEYFGIGNIDKWRTLGLELLQNKNIDNEGKNRGAVASINWLVNINSLKSIFGNLFELWEFQLSLGVEFLRKAYKYDQLPPGKRAACLLIGKEAFKFAEKTYNECSKDNV